MESHDLCDSFSGEAKRIRCNALFDAKIMRLFLSMCAVHLRRVSAPCNSIGMRELRRDFLLYKQGHLLRAT